MDEIILGQNRMPAMLKLRDLPPGVSLNSLGEKMNLLHPDMIKLALFSSLTVFQLNFNLLLEYSRQKKSK